MIIDLLNVQECFNRSRGPPRHYFGGDYQRIRRIYADFIGKLKANGITPIFVEDGPQVATKHSTWVGRKYEAMRKDMNPFFEALESGVNPGRHVEDSRAYSISEIIKDLGHKVFESRNSIGNHTVRNLHFLSKNSTLISRENCRFFWVKNS